MSVEETGFWCWVDLREQGKGLADFLHSIFPGEEGERAIRISDGVRGAVTELEVRVRIRKKESGVFCPVFE